MTRPQNFHRGFLWQISGQIQPSLGKVIASLDKPVGSFVKKPSNPIGSRAQCRLKKKRLCRRKSDSMWYQWVFASLLSLTWNSTSPIFLSRFRMISDQVLINKRRQSSSFCLDKLWTFDYSWSIKASSEMILKTGHPGHPQLTWLSHDYDIFFYIMMLFPVNIAILGVNSEWTLRLETWIATFNGLIFAKVHDTSFCCPQIHSRFLVCHMFSWFWQTLANLRMGSWIV